MIGSLQFKSLTAMNISSNIPRDIPRCNGEYALQSANLGRLVDLGVDKNTLYLLSHLRFKSN